MGGEITATISGVDALVAPLAPVVVYVDTVIIPVVGCGVAVGFRISENTIVGDSIIGLTRRLRFDGGLEC